MQDESSMDEKGEHCCQYSARAAIAAGRRGGYGAGCRGVVTLWVEGSSVCVTAAPFSLSGLSSLQGPGEYITEYSRAMGGRATNRVHISTMTRALT